MAKLNDSTIIEKNELHIIAAKNFDITKFHIGYDFLVLKKKLEDGNHLELSLWAYGKGMDEKTLATDLEIQVGIRDQNGDIDPLWEEKFYPEEELMCDLDALIKKFEREMLSAI